MWHASLLLRRTCALLLLTASLCGWAAERRVALVIGNAAYKEAPLGNPVNDATAMAQTLEEAGFTVRLLTNVDHRGTLQAVREFGDRLRQADVGVFYFAGHGMQIKGRNYLIPVGAEIQREDEVAYAALDAQAVLDKMESAGSTTNLVVLDACRNNPFARSFRASTPGLAQMEAPVGTLVAFATAPGSVASDGAGQHGLYTDHLLRAMRQPGAKVEDVFKRVRAGVRRASEGKQVPWEATSLEGDLVLFPTAPAPRVAQPPAAVTAMPAPPRPAITASKPPAARNAQGYTVGDRWNYQVIDRQRGEVVRNYTVRVSRVLPDGRWFSGDSTEFDAAGRLVQWITSQGEQRRNTPHALRWWPNMVVGETRRFDVEAIGQPASGNPWKQKVESEARVMARELVKVPAGEFTALRVEHQGSMRNVDAYGYGTFKVTVWYVPELHTWVAFEYRSVWNGKPDNDQREELTSYVLAGAR